MDNVLFPYETIRDVQQDMVDEVVACIQDGRHALIHAPTGIGKTAASLGPAIHAAINKGLNVFFLTSRHTQHKLAIDTLKDIKEKHDVPVIVSDIIAKQHMCAMDDVKHLRGKDFGDYCKKLRDENLCEYYVKAKKKSGSPTISAQVILEDLKRASPMHVEDFIKRCSDEKLCPYEMSMLLAESVHVVVSDYYYMFNPSIRETFLNKTNKELEKSVIIVDEAHNLPKRCRELLSSNLTSIGIRRAISEAAKHGYNEIEDKLVGLFDTLDKLSTLIEAGKDERTVGREEFVRALSNNIDEFSTELNLAADEIREKQKQSALSGISAFLDSWQGQDHGFARILSMKGGREPIITLSYKCLDPSLVCRDVLDRAHSVICMSGTLTPLFMYKDILGFSDVAMKSLESPFPKDNRLSMIVPETSTKYARRSEDEFKRIATIVGDIANTVPGNTLVFFPSYDVRNRVYPYMEETCTKQIMTEKQGLDKVEREELLEDFKKAKDDGALMMAVAAGSFGEGVDLKGDFLRCVIVVGLPLEKPTLEVKELIDYYEFKFGNGWEYGYTFPAMIKTIQNAGRCIRSETDKGVVVFLEERYAEERYLKCFPPDYHIKISKLYSDRVKNFFKAQC